MSRQQIVGVLSTFVVGAFLLYGQTLWFDFLDFDDTLLVTSNVSVLSAGSFSAIHWAFTHFDPELYIPLTFLSYQLDALLAGGTEAWMFHLTNLLLHVGCSVLIAQILLTLFRRFDVALLLGALFLFHPLNVEAVAWVSGRKDLLSAFFALASMAVYFSAYRYRIAGSTALFALGLLAKVSVAPLPLVLLLLDRLRGEKLSIKSVERVRWHLVVAVLAGLIALLGKDLVLSRSSPLTVLLLIPRTLLLYAQKLLWPVQLSVLYPVEGSTVSLLAIGIVLAVVILLWRMKDRVPALIIGATSALLLLVPSFFQYFRGLEVYLGSDRYMYLPFIGVLIAVAPLLAMALSRAVHVTRLVCGACLLALAATSFYTVTFWENTYLLFGKALEQHDSFLAHQKVGEWLLREGRLEEAVPHLKASLEMQPNAEAYFQLGIAAMDAGNPADAKAFTLEALSLSPDSAKIHINLSMLYWDEGNRTKALEHALLAVQYNPGDMMGLGNLATMYTLTGQKQAALEMIETILQIDPQNERVIPLQQKLQTM